MTRLGYQIPNFTYPGVPADRLFDTIVAQAREADESGFDTVAVMDHFYQLPMIGTADREMIECYTLLSALAQHTSRVRLSALVTGNTYRAPALLAKTVVPTRRDKRWEIELAPLFRMGQWQVPEIKNGTPMAVVGFTFKEEKGEAIVRAEYIFLDGKTYGLRSSPT